MSTGLRTFRCRTFQSRTFRPRTLAGSAGGGVDNDPSTGWVAERRSRLFVSKIRPRLYVAERS